MIALAFVCFLAGTAFGLANGFGFGLLSHWGRTDGPSTALSGGHGAYRMHRAAQRRGLAGR